MFLLRLLAIAAALLTFAARVCAAPPAHVELDVKGKRYEGKVIAHTDRQFWLVGQEGRLRVFETDQVKGFRQVSPQFRGWNTSIVKDQMRREFSRPFDVATTRHYVVVAQGDKARKFADLLEDFFGTYQMYFSLRGFKVPEPEFPLVAIVFPDQASFLKYGQQERQSLPKMVRGYYLSTSNRIAFFESDADGLSARGETGTVPIADCGLRTADWKAIDTNPQFEIRNPQFLHGSIEASLKDTLIHEATHQAAFNTGLHSRIGENPAWMVEGLATVFEAPGVRNARSNTGVKSRINPERFTWFGNFVKERRKPQSLEAFIAGDDLFKSNALDAYSQAWALTFFLFETRPRNYAEYLRAVALRNALERYTPEARVADFQRTISKDLKLLEAEFLRYMGDIR